MSAAADLTGRRFGRLVVLGSDESRITAAGKRLRRDICRCDCGVVKSFDRLNLTGGKSGSCGCRTLENARRAHRLLRSDDAGYNLVHLRVREDSGPARGHSCICGAPAAQWAYDHSDPDERIDPDKGLVFSVDQSHYLPLCLRCHRDFDAALREVRAHA